MSMISSNIKYLRKKHGVSQGALAEALGLPRTTLGDYERGKTEPNVEMLIKIAEHFKLKVDDLLRTNLSLREYEIIKNRDLRVLAISIDKENRGNIELVDTKAEAGYLESFSDPEYIRDLPKISFPNIPQGTYRGFEIQGDSMLPMQPGSIVLCSYVERLEHIKEDKSYVVVSKEDGLVYKRVRMNNEESCLDLFSDNEIYRPYSINFHDISEIWQYYAHLSFSDEKQGVENRIEERLVTLQKEVLEIRARMGGSV